jgi:hypothetical protein
MPKVPLRTVGPTGRRLKCGKESKVGEKKDTEDRLAAGHQRGQFDRKINLLASQEAFPAVTPAKAGGQNCPFLLDSGFRRNDGTKRSLYL